VKIYLFKSKWYAKGKAKFYVLNLSDKVKLVDLLKGALFLEELVQH
jgi:hypothetical protein